MCPVHAQRPNAPPQVEKWCFAMKKVITFVALLSMTSIGWAGTNREATNDRLNHAGQCFTRSWMRRIRAFPQEVLEHAQVRRRCAPSSQGRLCVRSGKWPRRGDLQDRGRLERSYLLRHHRRQLGIADRRRGNRPGHDHPERARHAPVLSSKFELGADASAAAGPVGRHASADTDWKMDAEILTYSRARGPLPDSRLTALRFVTMKTRPSYLRPRRPHPSYLPRVK